MSLHTHETVFLPQVGQLNVFCPLAIVANSDVRHHPLETTEHAPMDTNLAAMGLLLHWFYFPSFLQNHRSLICQNRLGSDESP